MRNLITNYYGFINENINTNVILNMYYVHFYTDETTELVYNGVDREKAFNEYMTFNDIPKEMLDKNNMNVQISMSNEVYRIKPSLDAGDYSLEDYYKDSSIYLHISSSEPVTLEERDIEPVNTKSDELLRQVQSHYKQKYGKYKYNLIDIHDDSDEYKGDIKLRIADHSENILNNDRNLSTNFFISVVICEYDVVSNRFDMVNNIERRSTEIQLKYDSSDSFEKIVEEIDENISNFTDILLYI